MRAFFGWLGLLALCGAAWFWQSQWTHGVREERDSLRGAPGSFEEREQSWGTITIGRPSGAAPIELDDLPPDPGPGGGEQDPVPFLVNPGTQPGTDPPSPAGGDFEYVVPRGRVLSKICEDFYGSGRAPIPERVATYNGLKSPDAIREGLVLKLPAWVVLFPERPGGPPQR